MIILDKPFVSEFLVKTIIENKIPVLATIALSELVDRKDEMMLVSENEAIELIKNNPHQRIYTNSENAIGWISSNLGFSEIYEKIIIFKDKVLFRDLLCPVYPRFYYRSVDIDKLDNLRINLIPKPFIIKPAVGFFSMAVYKVDTDDEWETVKGKIKKEIEFVKDIYPKEVMDTQKFIIEQVIEGAEFAVDAYYNEIGEVVVTNIMEHVFASGNDFSDRLYITSEKIIKEKIGIFEKFLQNLGTLAKLKNFPLHVELRINNEGEVMPIEVNPLRFGAWCTTADATWYAYGFNSIAAFFRNEKPNWDKILAGKEGKIYAMMVLENSTGFQSNEIQSFNYSELLANFEKPIDLRRIDYNKYPVFGFLFTETKKENFIELENILQSDLKKYIKLKMI
jgi:hypothetical protein